MNTYQALKAIRDRLQKEISEGKKQHEKLSRDLTALTAQVRGIEANVAANTRLITDLDALLRHTSEPSFAAPVTPKKRGPKPGAKKAAAATTSAATDTTAEPKVRKKPGPKPKAKAEPKTTNKVAKTETKAEPKKRGPKPRKGAAEGRRAVAEGLRPPIKDAIQKVMSGKAMSIDDIFEGLKAKSWLPNSSEPRQYISYILSTSKDRFERVVGSRGVYKPKGTTADKAPKAAKAAPVVSTDEILANAGLLGDAIFGE
jgi:hypothetical protein